MINLNAMSETSLNCFVVCRRQAGLVMRLLPVDETRGYSGSALNLVKTDTQNAIGESAAEEFNLRLAEEMNLNMTCLFGIRVKST